MNQSARKQRRLRLENGGHHLCESGSGLRRRVCNISINSLVLAVIATTPSLREDPTTLLVFSLIASDVVYGACVIGGSATICSLPEPPTATFKSVFASVAIRLNVATFYNICCISLCKMIAIAHQLRNYLALVTEHRWYIVIAINWTVSLVLATPLMTIDITWNVDMCFYQRRHFNFGDTLHLLSLALLGGIVPVCVLIYTNSRIFVDVMRTLRRIAVEGTQKTRGDAVVVRMDQPESLPILKTIRSSRNVIVICVAYIFAVTPAVIMTTVSSTCQVQVPSDVDFAFLLVFYSTSMNGLLYLRLHSAVRNAARNTFSLCR